MVPELTRQLYELSRGKQWDLAMTLQYRITELFDAMLYPFEFPDGFRAAAEMRGFDFGEGRQPLSTKQKQGRAPLERVLEGMLVDFGLIKPRVDGTAAPDMDTPEAAIRQIVAEVLQELSRRGAL